MQISDFCSSVLMLCLLISSVTFSVSCSAFYGPRHRRTQDFTMGGSQGWIQEFSYRGRERSEERKSPSGVQGKSPGSGAWGQSPPEADANCEIC